MNEKVNRYHMYAGDGPGVYEEVEPEGEWVMWEDYKSLLEALMNVEREHELLRWMKDCERQRGRGSFGIAVEKDGLAAEWQSYDKELKRLTDTRRAAIAKAKGGHVNDRTN